MPAGNGPGGQTIGGGIAGVASNSEGEGVMVYNDRSKYKEWEFIFDPTKVKQIPNPNATGAGGTPASQLGSTAGQAGQQAGPQPTPQPGANPQGPQNANPSPFGPPNIPNIRGGRQ